jgi:hypothetical protein
MNKTQSTQANPTKQHPGSTDSPASTKRFAQRPAVTPGDAAWTRYAHSRLKLFGHIR